MPLPDGDFQNFRSIQDLLVGFYGGALISLPHDSDFAIDTTAVLLDSTRRLMRIGRYLSNTGATNIAISYSSSVTINTGILLLPGGFWREDWYYDGDLVERPLYAIGSAAGGTLHQLERFLVGA